MDQVSVIQPIGEGAFGTVELAVYKGEHVAIKKQLVRNEGLDKYLATELTILKNLTPHPNMLRYIGAGWRPAGGDAAALKWTEVRCWCGVLSLYCCCCCGGGGDVRCVRISDIAAILIPHVSR